MDNQKFFGKGYAKMMANIRKKSPVPTTIEFFHTILKTVQPLLEAESSLLELDAPITVVGDIHGETEGMISILDDLRWPPHTSYLFLGDYVDRGKRSTESIMILLGLKVIAPEKIFLLRGNHEFRVVNSRYGLQKEMNERFGDDGENLYKSLNSVFDYLPLAARIKERIFCTHGGISSELKTMDQIRTISRPLSTLPDKGLLVDLLWADPSSTISGYEENKARGISFIFGEDAAEAFCEEFGIDMIIRGHQCFVEGHSRCGKVLTIFGAVDYENQNNDACVARVDANLKVELKVYQSKSKGPKRPSEQAATSTNVQESIMPPLAKTESKPSTSQGKPSKPSTSQEKPSKPSPSQEKASTSGQTEKQKTTRKLQPKGQVQP